MKNIIVSCFANTQISLVSIIKKINFPNTSFSCTKYM